MKRRTFGQLAGSSVVAIQAAAVAAKAQSAAPDASQLGTTLTPYGAEMAGNADGSIPAWKGGVTTLPAGVGPNDFVPDLFADEQAVLVIDASNQAQYSALLTEGVQTMLTKYSDFKVKIYPTHRSAAAPQWVYDNIKNNAATAKFTADDSVGGRFGFEGAFGGIPFPIPDTSNPFTAGAQIMYNAIVPWLGRAQTRQIQGWTVSNGQTSMAFSAYEKQRFPYYIAQSLDELNQKYSGIYEQIQLPYDGPANFVGQNIISWQYLNNYKHPQQAWELLNGQGRVRRAPELSFDTPASQANGICNYDEYYGFNGSLERYDWKFLGKQELYVPYNNNGLFASNPQKALLAHCLNPDVVRWEKHRVWVVEATLHPGERNVLARRKLYIDEDTWLIALVDAWDANNDLFHVNIAYNRLEPGLPGVVYGNNTVNNLQVDSYVGGQCTWDGKPEVFYDNWPDLTFDPANMAAGAQY